MPHDRTYDIGVHGLRDCWGSRPRRTSGADIAEEVHTPRHGPIGTEPEYYRDPRTGTGIKPGSLSFPLRVTLFLTLRVASRPLIPIANSRGALIGPLDHSGIGFWMHRETRSSIQSDGVSFHNKGPLQLSALIQGSVCWAPNSFSLLPITTRLLAQRPASPRHPFPRHNLHPRQPPPHFWSFLPRPTSSSGVSPFSSNRHD